MFGLEVLSVQDSANCGTASVGGAGRANKSQHISTDKRMDFGTDSFIVCYMVLQQNV